MRGRQKQSLSSFRIEANIALSLLLQIWTIQKLQFMHPRANPEPSTFRFSVTGSYYSALERQLSEAIKIQRASTQKTTVLNSKFEFNRCLIPTIVTEDTKTKPYHTNLRYERDPDEPEDEEWDDDENPQKRLRNNEFRRK